MATLTAGPITSMCPLLLYPNPWPIAVSASVTTAAPDEAGGKVRVVYDGCTNPAPEALHTQHLFWHKTATHTNDRETYLPINLLNTMVEEGRLGSLSPRFYGAPTKYSQRQTREETAPAILNYFQADQVDIALLVPL